MFAIHFVWFKCELGKLAMMVEFYQEQIILNMFGVKFLAMTVTLKEIVLLLE